MNYAELVFLITSLAQFIGGSIDLITFAHTHQYPIAPWQYQEKCCDFKHSMDPGSQRWDQFVTIDLGRDVQGVTVSLWYGAFHCGIGC